MSTTKPLKLFAITDKKNPHAVARLIKGESKVQVTRYLANSVSIDLVAPLDVFDIVSGNPDTMLEDASIMPEETPDGGGDGDTGGAGAGDGSSEGAEGGKTTVPGDAADGTD